MQKQEQENIYRLAERQRQEVKVRTILTTFPIKGTKPLTPKVMIVMRHEAFTQTQSPSHVTLTPCCHVFPSILTPHPFSVPLPCRRWRTA